MPRKPRRNCLNCGEECARANQWYCNNACQHEYQDKEAYEQWLSGASCQFSDARTKKFIARQRGYKCEVCGIHEWQGKPIVLEIDHINGAWDENGPENVRLICPNCHSQTDTYKNKGGRSSVRN
jgi:hypothetical protein